MRRMKIAGTRKGRKEGEGKIEMGIEKKKKVTEESNQN